MTIGGFELVYTQPKKWRYISNLYGKYMELCVKPDIILILQENKLIQSQGFFFE